MIDKPKKKKKKKYNLNAILKNAIRRTWEYHPLHKSINDSCRRYAPRYKKDGTRHKTDSVIGYECSKCHALVEKVEIHHLVAVAPKKGELFDWNKHIDRMFNGEQVGICAECHMNYHPERRKKK